MQEEGPSSGHFLNIWVGRGLRESPGEPTVLGRLIETQIWPPAGSMGAGLSKGTKASASTSVSKKAAAPALELRENELG